MAKSKWQMDLGRPIALALGFSWQKADGKKRRKQFEFCHLKFLLYGP